MDILVAHGVNLDLLGSREPNVYGSLTLSALNHRIALDGQTLSKALGLPNPSLTFFQSNREDEFLLKISEQFDGILMNPGAWTHTSLALADRLEQFLRPFRIKQGVIGHRSLRFGQGTQGKRFKVLAPPRCLGDQCQH